MTCMLKNRHTRENSIMRLRSPPVLMPMKRYRIPTVSYTHLYIYDQCPHEELTIIMRRYMMRIAERLAVDVGACLLYTSTPMETAINFT